MTNSEHLNPPIGSLWIATPRHRHRMVFIVSFHQDPASNRNVFGAMHDDGKLFYGNSLSFEWVRIL